MGWVRHGMERSTLSMRQQHSKRPRGGRPNNGRKPHNHGGPNRSYDSNGPDVKIRGTASHIYDKYQQLARDAQSAGDRIAAENYLQHAEHYYRLMVAANPGIVQQRNGNGGYPQQPAAPGEGPQPGFDGLPPRAMPESDENEAEEFGAEDRFPA
jgi:hypothetical protein